MARSLTLRDVPAILSGDSDDLVRGVLSIGSGLVSFEARAERIWTGDHTVTPATEGNTMHDGKDIVLTQRQIERMFGVVPVDLGSWLFLVGEEHGDQQRRAAVQLRARARRRVRRALRANGFRLNEPPQPAAEEAQ